MIFNLSIAIANNCTIFTSWSKCLWFPCCSKLLLPIQSLGKIFPFSTRMAVHIVVCICMVLLCVSGVSLLDLLQQWLGNIKSSSCATYHLFPLVCWYLVQYLSDNIHWHSGVWGDRVMCSNTVSEINFARRIPWGLNWSLCHTSLASLTIQGWNGSHVTRNILLCMYLVYIIHPLTLLWFSIGLNLFS